jgi:predicted nucleic acid-binding protein
LRISLDSNVFGDQDFIDWLQERKELFEISLSIICALETYHWYNIRGISHYLFERDLEALNAIVQDLTLTQIYEISANAKRATLPFKHHARDFIIGTQTILSQSTLITFNLRHFDWLEEEKVLSPDELVLKVENDELDS